MIRKQYGISTASPEAQSRHQRMLDKSYAETRNEEARALIDKAWETCSGCRAKWRLLPDTLNHRVDGLTFRCWAAKERQQLRDMIKEMAG